MGRSRRASWGAGGPCWGACALGVRHAGICCLRGRALKEGWLQEPEAAGRRPHGSWRRAGHSAPDRADGRRGLSDKESAVVWLGCRIAVVRSPTSHCSMRPPRKRPQTIVMSVITVMVARKVLIYAVLLVTLTMTMT